MDYLINALRAFGTGLILLGLIFWVVVDTTYRTIFIEQAVSTDLIVIREITFEQSDYAIGGDQQFTVTVDYRNDSPLRLVAIEADYRLMDCTRNDDCANVDTQNLSTSLDTPSGMRGRFTATFVVQRMAAPVGQLRLIVTPRRLDGATD